MKAVHEPPLFHCSHSVEVLTPPHLEEEQLVYFQDGHE